MAGKFDAAPLAIIVGVALIVGCILVVGLRGPIANNARYMGLPGSTAPGSTAADWAGPGSTSPQWALPGTTASYPEVKT